MDVSATMSQSLYSYQTALASGGQSASVYTQSQAQSTTDTSGIQGLQLSQVAGGLDAASSNALLASLSNSSPSGLQGFDNVITGSTSLSAMAFQAQKAYGTGTLSSDAQALSGAGANGQGTGSASNPAYVQQAVAASQQLALSNTFTLLA